MIRKRVRMGRGPVAAAEGVRVGSVWVLQNSEAVPRLRFRRIPADCA